MTTTLDHAVEEHRRILEKEEEEEEEVDVRFHIYICNVSSYCLFSKIPYDIPDNSQNCQNKNDIFIKIFTYISAIFFPIGVDGFYNRLQIL